MEIRTLKYFLETAREENMTRASERLHVSQSTMSKQIKELESELGTKLFQRSNYSIKLTDAGMLLRERAENILELVDKTISDFHALDDLNSGDIFIGAAESDSIEYFARVVKNLRNDYPKIKCHMFSGDMDDVTERLDRGLLDFAIVMSFVDLNKYNFLKFPASDIWGVYMLKNDPLAEKNSFNVQDLLNLPLICSRQWIDQDLPRWFDDVSKVNIVATYNLSFNAFKMVRAGIGYAVTYDKLTADSDLIFRRIESVPKSEMYIIWRKKQIFTPIAKLLLNYMKDEFSKS